MKLLAFAIALLMICLALTGIAWPEGLVRAGHYSFIPSGVYVAAGVRLAIGLVFFLAAPASRAPRTLRIIGVVVCVAGLTIAFLSVDRASELLDWWSAKGVGFVRVAAVGVLAVGSFIAYVTAPRRR
jgi:hypothetical protein